MKALKFCADLNKDRQHQIGKILDLMWDVGCGMWDIEMGVEVSHSHLPTSVSHTLADEADSASFPNPIVFWFAG